MELTCLFASVYSFICHSFDILFSVLVYFQIILCRLNALVSHLNLLSHSVKAAFMETVFSFYYE